MSWKRNKNKRSLKEIDKKQVAKELVKIARSIIGAVKFQVATTTNPNLPFRKWQHHGTIYGRTAIDAIFKKFGVIVKMDSKTHHWKSGEVYYRLN